MRILDLIWVRIWVSDLGSDMGSDLGSHLGSHLVLIWVWIWIRRVLLVRIDVLACILAIGLDRSAVLSLTFGLN